MTKEKTYANKAIVYVGIGLLVGVILTLILFSTAGQNNQLGMMRMTGITTQNGYTQQTMMGNIDQHFIELMIPHHEDAITMAKLAQTKAQHVQVKELADSIIDSQGKEINQMKDWYKIWYGKEVSTGYEVMNQRGMMGNNNMHMGMMGDKTDIARLEGTTNFDKVFIEQMIPHHQMAVMMASMLKSGTTRPEMKKLADDIIAAQTKEIEGMRQWYKRWGFE